MPGMPSEPGQDQPAGPAAPGLSRAGQVAVTTGGSTREKHANTHGGYSEATQIRTLDNGGYPCGGQRSAAFTDRNALPVLDLNGTPTLFAWYPGSSIIGLHA